ncbi:molybdate ABC transporter substrate-binding protein [Pseudoflavonifractor sp. MSJ-37]|uniref:molybdate ABC transporter substrate-binding protein n=1 Tax=Pseudoflavonifractor sp. MSJ-37 TaxID=2841531 RepID=UPI001C106678|nr:molybdate ABC transporter substrate-binding protein [Pseudoflavonifractor sp. MSJ-37]MBU5434032.1 molybdate ABC transporter substrate-binding protein [Pseudoflavonifractor sp. MSJ-37]
MKKVLSLTMALAMTASLAACGGNSANAPAESTKPAESTAPAASEAPAGDPVELTVFAAASMEASLTKIADLYKDVAPNVTLTYNFDSSGTLKTQIQEGAACDLFISAGQKQMNALDAADTTGTNEDGQDLVYSDTRIDLVQNKVVLAVPDDNTKDIQSFSDLATDKLNLVCLGNDDVPVGSYSLDILKSLDIDITELENAGKVTYASNVSEVATQVKEGAVDCGIIYATDANTYELTVVDEATGDMCKKVIYPAAVMKSGAEASKEAAEDFLTYLHTDADAIAVLEDVGFTVLQ